ncbi:MAG: winged helix-turn-helix domain-containing protein [Pseudomonadota bacterium]
MKEGPDIAALATLIGDPARANMLAALMGGRALTATELAAEAGITAQTASAHLAKLVEGGLLLQRKQGRHRYHALASDEVGAVLEGLMGLAARQGRLRTRAGPRDPALRRARVCYDHLAGEMGVAMFDSLRAGGLLAGDEENVILTEAGRAFAAGFGVDMEALEAARRPVCRACLDWSMRRTHLAGGLGAALLTRIYDLGWARRVEGGRAVVFTPAGEAAFARQFAS